MRVSFPAMRARMGGREYYCTTMALSEIPRFFKFNNWETVTPELRAQRELNDTVTFQLQIDLHHVTFQVGTCFHCSCMVTLVPM